jgi:transformer-2 protein
MFGKFGKLEKVSCPSIVQMADTGLQAVLVLDRAGHSKGYAFITFRHVQDAASARAALNRAGGTGDRGGRLPPVLDDREMRVDYSFTRRAHSPTPGCFRGRSVPSGLLPRSHPGGTS